MYLFVLYDVNTEVSKDTDWRMLVGLLPENLEELALSTGAIVRRREVRTASDLVRLALVYAEDDASLRGASAWALEAGVASLSDQALQKRLRGSVGLLRELCSSMLPPAALRPNCSDLRLILVDSTTICRKRSSGIDFRVHVNYAAASGQIVGLELTPASQGEGLDRLACGPNDLLVADQGYPSRSRLARVLERGAQFLVRFYPSNLPLEERGGVRVDPLELCAELSIGEILDVPLSTIATSGAPSIDGRLVVVRKTDDEAKSQLKRTRRNSRKEPSDKSSMAARYIMIFTSLTNEQASAQVVLDAYRIRWQVEVAFKRAKGVVSLGETLAKDLQLCEAKILAKLLLLLMIQKFETSFFPWGYPLPRSQPVEAA